MSQIQLNISQSRGYEKYELNQVKAYSNAFTKVKLTLKSRYQAIAKTLKQVKETKVIIKDLENQKNQLLKEASKIFNCNDLFILKQELSTQYATLRELEVLVAGTEENIQGLECCMFDLVKLGDTYLSTHQKVQLLGGGIEKAREIIKTLIEMEKLSSIEDVRFIDLVMHHTEYQWNKQRAKWWIDCEIWEMPVFQACMEEMIRRIHDYEEETGRCIMTEFMEERAKENGKKLVPLQTEHGIMVTFQDDIEAKYECHGNVIALKNGSSVTVYKKD